MTLRSLHFFTLSYQPKLTTSGQCFSHKLLNSMQIFSAVAPNKQFATFAVARNARRLTISPLGPQNVLLPLKLIMLLTTNAAGGELMSCETVGVFITHAQKATAVQCAAPTENFCSGHELPCQRENQRGGKATALKHLPLPPSPAVPWKWDRWDAPLL